MKTKKVFIRLNKFFNVKLQACNNPWCNPKMRQIIQDGDISNDKY